MNHDRERPLRPVFCDAVSCMQENRVTIFMPHIHLAIGYGLLSRLQTIKARLPEFINNVDITLFYGGQRI